ncbi:15459_t:CDS:2, partial [Gigaspora margarita]
MNTLQNKFLTKKEQEISYLQKKRGNKILNNEKDPPELLNNWQDNSKCNTEPNGSNLSDNYSRTSKTKKRKLEYSKIDTYLAKPLNK